MQGHLLLGRLDFWPKRLSGYGNVTIKCPQTELKLAPEAALVLLTCKRAKEDVLEGFRSSFRAGWVRIELFFK